MRPLLVAFHGLPGVGKDAAANRLVESGTWSKVSFAAPLKRGLSEMLGIPMEDIDNPSIKNEPDYKFGRSIRYMLQTLGTEWGRNLIDDSLWMKLAQESIERQFQHGLNVVNTDLRFLNEAEKVKEMGGYVIHILRNDNVNGDISLKTGAQSHASNVTLPTEFIDYTIHNNYSLQMFEDEISRIVTEIALNHG